MTAQCVGFSLLLTSCLLALTSSAPLTSLELDDGNEVMSKTLNLVRPLRLELRHFDTTPLSGDVEDRTPLADVEDADTDTQRSYVDASVFRKVSPVADAVKPKPSSFVKKLDTTLNKNVKKGREMKVDVSVPSDKLEPPGVDGKDFEVEVVVDDKDATIREIVDDKDATIREIVATEVESMTTSEATMTSSGTNEDDELPRLSPPIWLHSSLAEAMSDPLRLPMIETYDRYDRYSHSIARDSLW